VSVFGAIDHANAVQLFEQLLHLAVAQHRFQLPDGAAVQPTSVAAILHEPAQHAHQAIELKPGWQT